MNTRKNANDDTCPKCGVSFQGQPIPPDQQESFGATHFSRKIGVEVLGTDRIGYWQCPDCGHEWECR